MHDRQRGNVKDTIIPTQLGMSYQHGTSVRCIDLQRVHSMVQYPQTSSTRTVRLGGLFLMCCPPALLDDRTKLLELAFRAEKGTELWKLHLVIITP